MKKILDIGEVVKITGVPPSTLRFYEEKGLIQSAGRNGLRRYFNARVLESLDFIAMGQQAGFSLNQISEMFGGDGRLEIDRELLILKAKQLEQEIIQLAAIRDTLRHVARCKAVDHLACPKFQKLLRLAGRKSDRNRNSRG